MEVRFKNVERQMTVVDAVSIVIDDEVVGRIEPRAFESNGFVYWCTDHDTTKFLGLKRFICFESKKKAKRYIESKYRNRRGNSK